MDSRYKIIVSNKNIYREIELAPDAKEVKLGTGVNCDVRLRKDLFFGQVELTFIKGENGWNVLSSDNLYLTVGDVRKMMTMNLHHGDILFVKYQESDNDVFSIEFLIDFDNGKKKYERAISLSSVSSFTIGSSTSSNIVIGSQYVKNDAIEVSKKGSSLFITTKKSTYGVYHNGRKCLQNEEIKNGDFFSISDYFFYYKNDVIWTEIRNDLSINQLTFSDIPSLNSYPKFNRNTRVKSVINDEKIEILDPPAKPQEPKNNFISRLLPSLIMVVSGIAMSFVSPFMLISSALGVVTAITSIIQGKKDFKNDSAERIKKYNAYIENKRKEIESCRADEHKVLEELYISQDVEQDRLTTFSSDLFDRTKDDEDYLCVRLGNGDVEAKREVNYKKQEKLEVEDDLQQMPEAICNEYKNVHNAPIVCDLKEANAVGVIGSLENRFTIFKNIVIDLVARHYFTDVKLFFVTENEHKEQIRWLRMLPHAYNDDIGIRNIVCDDDSKNIIFEYLYKELTFREQNKNFQSNIIVFFYDEYGFKSHPISKFVDKAKDLGVTFIFFGNDKSDIPLGCDYIIDIKNQQNASLINSHDKCNFSDFSYSTITNAQAESIVNLLAPVYTEEISLESSLTKNISLFELLNIIAVDDIDLDGRWKKSQVFKSMSAPIGVSKSGVVSLDLHDKAHGPHGLVAGTTGSGKSEILQTYILAMTTLFHPYEVAFVIIDFKGGGMVNQFKELPHLLGAITNIDGRAINRSLKSIKAELQKRQRLFADADVNHIDKYIKKYKSGEVSTPLPHLIIIVDEFAELKAEQPEFMKELISAARIGRSLGVHLILATQKPSGQVNEQIWSNSRFKLCLKVQSQEDSNEVLKSPLAAEIKEPGRAYLQVGNNEIFELFQSAYSGASEKADDSKVKEFTIFGLNDSGRRVPVYVQKKQKTGEGSSTQLDAIVKYVSDYCKGIGLDKLPDICLPALNEKIPFEISEKKSSTQFMAEIGVFDDPDNQNQDVYSVDVSNNNIIIIGSSQSGKTTVLQNIIRSLSTKFTPDEVNIYVVDFASMILKNFDRLNHVGGVVCPSEDEKLKNLFKLLYSEIETRKEKLMSVGVSSFSAYREAGMTDLPLIVLMIDNLTALKELYFQEDDELLNLCREGLTVGVSIIISNSQTAGIGYKYLSNFSTKIAMFCNDSNEYGSLFDHCSERVDNIPGRCIIELDKRHLECQAYLAFNGGKEIDRVKEIKNYVDQTNAQYKNSRAHRIPLIPSSLTKAYMLEQFSSYMEQPFSIVSGLDYATVTPYVTDFSMLGTLAIAGREKSGKHNWLKYSVDMLSTVYPGMTKVYAVDGIGKKLASLKQCDNIAMYSMVAEDAIVYIKDIEMQLKDRYEALVAGNEDIVSSSELLMLVIDNPDALLAICNDKDALAAYKNIIGRYKNMRVCIITFIENANIPYSAPEIMKNIRDQKNFLFFDDLANMKLFDVPLNMMRNNKKAIELGDGYRIIDNECIKIKTPISSQIVG